MDIITSCKQAFPDIRIPDAARYYSEHIAVWKDIFENTPPWKSVRRSGLYNRGNRPLKRLNTAKCLCDEFAALTFSEQCNITIDDAQYQQYVLDVLEHNSFWDSMPDLVASAYAFGGAAVKVYANDRQPVLDYIRTDRFVPTEWMGKRIRGGIFQSTQCSSDKIYTLCERYTANGQVYNKLFRSDSANDLGTECQLSDLGIKAQPKTDYGAGVPMFGYFKPSVSSNVEYEIPLGMSIYANAMDTLAALDVAFDSFYREFILGKKRIIVPSAAVQTVTDPDSGQLVRYFDADDEVFTALSAEEGDALKVTDNTMELRVDEHVRAINALLNILCFQTGLSAGALSFDAVQGLKTATEVISQDSKTARTIKCNKNMLTEMLEDVIHAIVALGVWLHQLPRRAYTVTVGWQDNVVIDDNTLIDNNIKLVQAGLKSKVSAIMEVLKCDEDTARQELERIASEQSVSGLSVDDLMGGGEDDQA